jgi:hypothetical protein
MKKHNKRTSGGSCGCALKTKLWGGSLRKRDKRQTRRRHRSLRIQIAGNAHPVIPLNSFLHDPRAMTTSERLSVPVASRGGKTQKRKYKSRGGGKTQKRKYKSRGGGFVDYLWDPLLGKPDALTGFGSSAGVPDSLKLLNGSSLARADGPLGVSPKV